MSNATVEHLVEIGELRQEHADALAPILAQVRPGARYLFLTGGRGSLGGISPLEALRRGNLEGVLATARAYVE